MLLIDPKTVVQLLTSTADEAEIEELRKTLINHGWGIGAPIEEKATFREWYLKMRETALNQTGVKRIDILPELGTFLLALAIGYFSEIAPEDLHNRTLRIAIGAGLVAYYGTGLYGGFGTDSYALERFVDDLVNRVFLGNYAGETGLYIIPHEELERQVNEEQTRYVLRLISALLFDPHFTGKLNLVEDAIVAS